MYHVIWIIKFYMSNPTEQLKYDISNYILDEIEPKNYETLFKLDKPINNIKEKSHEIRNDIVSLTPRDSFTQGISDSELRLATLKNNFDLFSKILQHTVNPLPTVPITLDPNATSKFIELCKFYDITTIEKFLDDKINANVDLHADNEKAFLNACINNTIDVVVYLYNKITPLLTVNNGYIFTFTCFEKRIEIINFLMHMERSFTVLIEKVDQDGIFNYIVHTDTIKTSFESQSHTLQDNHNDSMIDANADVEFEIFNETSSSCDDN